MQPGDSAAPVSGAMRPPLVVGHRGAWGPPPVLSHRGAWAQPPQNSLQAFERAIAMGCDAIEIDVRRSADDRLVVVHDARVGGRSVARQDHSELKARLSAGQAPSLEEVLELAAGRVVVDVELKEDGYAAAAMTAIASRLGPDQYVVTSFRPRVLAAVRRAAPEAQTGLLIGSALLRRELDRRGGLGGPAFL